MQRFFAVLLFVLCFWKWPSAYKRHIEKITTSGHTCKPSGVVIFFARALFKFITFFFVGRVRVIGEENLRTREGERIIVNPNHSSLLDVPMFFATIGKPLWSIGADDVLKKAWGIPGLIATKMRTMPVDRSHGRTVIAPSIELVVRGKSMLMFPEGKIDPSGQMFPFKLGAAIIGNAAQERIGEDGRVGLVPMAMIYHRRDNATALNFLRMGFKWRKGATLVVCPPIWLNDLTNRDPEHIMALVKDAIAQALAAHKPR